MNETVLTVKDSRKYKTLVTDKGNAKIALAVLNGEKVNVTTAVVGDGGGMYYSPTPDMTALKHEVWRGEIANKEINAASANMVDVKIVLDGSVGGFTVREIGLLDADGDLIAICNTPDTEKAVILDGIAATLTLIMHVVFTNVDAVEFQIDPSVDKISAEEMDAAIQKHNADPNAHGGIGSAKLTMITIPESAWVQNSSDNNYTADVDVEDAQDGLYPSVTLYGNALATAYAAGMSQVTQALDGKLRFWAAMKPAADMVATVALFFHSGGSITPSSMPVATSDTIGGVKVKSGSGLNIDESGNLTLDNASAEDVEKLFDGE